MNRPYIFCHMMTSLDGKIMGSYMNTKEGENAGNVFYNISFGENPYYKHQGWLSGRVTTDDNFTFYEKPALDECNLVRRTEKGRLRRRGWGLRWEKAQKGGKGTNLRGFFED